MGKSSNVIVGLGELRQAYASRLAAVSAAGNRLGDGSSVNGIALGDDDLAIDVNCFSGMIPFPQQMSPQRNGERWSDVNFFVSVGECNCNEQLRDDK
jgi:hypothetical protein